MSDNKTIHMKKFDGGRSTPAEYHRKTVYAGRACTTCGQPAAMSAKLLADDAEFLRRHPEAYMALINRHGGDPSFETKWGKMVTVEVVYACDQCKDGMRRFVASRATDYMHVELDEAGLEESYALQKGAS
jgi:hypothetical protein